MRLKIFLIALIIAVLSTYLDTFAEQNKGIETTVNQHFDWNNSSPLDFIYFLRNYEKNSYIVIGVYKDWIKIKHIPQLIQLLNSEEECANVASAYSSYMDTNKSTVGNEAAYLINAFRIGQYPPGLNSTRPKPDKEEILSWWENR